MHAKLDQERLTVFKGTFIDLAAEPDVAATSTAPPVHNLRIREGVISVKNGRITDADWSVKTEEDLCAFLKSKYGYEEKANAAAAAAPLADASNEITVDTASDIRVVRSSEEQNGFFFPGFVDTHIHAPQYQNVGIFGKTTLLDWLTTYTFPLESSFREKKDGDHCTKYDTVPPQLAYDRVVQKTLSHGTTCASYFGTIHVQATHMLARICRERGQRALIGRVCMDRKDTCADFYRDESTEDALAATKESVKAILDEPSFSGLIEPIVTPRFAPSCTEEALKGLAEVAASYEPPLRIQTHISENLKEIEWVKELFPGSKSYADVYDRYGLLTPRMILAHGIHLSPEERSLIQQRGSGISHCPPSNSAIGSGLCPVRTLLDSGIPVGLGTDVSGGWHPSMLEVVRQTCLVSRLLEFSQEYIKDQRECGKNDIEHGRQKIGVPEALYLATRGGAKVVDMHGDDGIGGFDVGRQFDAQLIELGVPLTQRQRHEVEQYDRTSSNVDIFGWETWEEKIDKWVWNGDDRNVKSVWVAGAEVKR